MFQIKYFNINRLFNSIFSFFSPLLVIVASLNGIITYLILTNLTPIEPTRFIFLLLLIINLIFVFLLSFLVIRGFALLWRERMRKQAGSKLHTKLVILFAIMATLPAILVAIFAFVTLKKGLDNWFSDKTKNIIHSATVVAEAYIEEHQDILRHDTLIMAEALNRAKILFDTDKRQFHAYLTDIAKLHAIPMAVIIDSKGGIIDMADTNKYLPLQSPPQSIFNTIENDHPVILISREQAQIRSLMRLDKFSQLFLYLAHRLDPRIIDYLGKTDNVLRDYTYLENQRSSIQVTFTLIYIIFALVILLSAIWFGMYFADKFVFSIRKFIIAAQRISLGDLDARVDIGQDDDEIEQLGTTFNQMTEQLSIQRKNLVDAHVDMEIRHQFIQMVLGGINSGVMGIDNNGIINHNNMLAAEICLYKQEKMIGKNIDEVFPIFSNLLCKVIDKDYYSTEIEYKNKENVKRHLFVKITRGSGIYAHNYVITFDDITSLIVAQRTVAWSDVARRIAHEIKNPLTPIQLSAERLQSKYGKEISSDIGVFKQCTETIIRQVGDIERMVDEFSAFGRMPAVVFKKFDIYDSVAQTIFLQGIAHQDIQYILDKGNCDKLMLNGDNRLLRQALTNILKNSAESIYKNQERKESKIIVSLIHKHDRFYIKVMDTGQGWPNRNKEDLLEPYVTTHNRGRGLGLSIVKKIMEDHGGKIIFGDAPWVCEGKSGAQVFLEFPYCKEEASKQYRVKEVVL